MFSVQNKSCTCYEHEKFRWKRLKGNARGMIGEGNERSRLDVLCRGPEFLVTPLQRTLVCDRTSLTWSITGGGPRVAKFDTQSNFLLLHADRPAGQRSIGRIGHHDR